MYSDKTLYFIERVQRFIVTLIYGLSTLVFRGKIMYTCTLKTLPNKIIIPAKILGSLTLDLQGPPYPIP